MDLFEELLTSSSSKSVSPETLEFIGQKAANLFLEKKASLNDAIVKLASVHPELNNEHIHRIAEFANNTTFKELFQKEHDKHIHFDVANPGEIIRDLRDGGSPAHSGKTLNSDDYTRNPIPGEKHSVIDDGSPMSQFASSDVEKNASVHEAVEEGSENPINDVYAQHVLLKRMQEELSVNHETSDLMYKEAQEDFYRAVKSEVLSPTGAGLGNVAVAVEKIAGDQEATYFAQVCERLIEEGVHPDTLQAQLYKTAGRVLNPEHPLVMSLSAMVKTAQDRATAAEALRDVKQGLVKTASFLRAQAKS